MPASVCYIESAEIGTDASINQQLFTNSSSVPAGMMGGLACKATQTAMHSSAGEAHLAALHLLSVSDVAAALGVYRRAGLQEEAALLAAARLAPDHPDLAELHADPEDSAASAGASVGPTESPVELQDHAEDYIAPVGVSRGADVAAAPAESERADHATVADLARRGPDPAESAAGVRHKYGRAELLALRTASPLPTLELLSCLPRKLSVRSGYRA